MGWPPNVGPVKRSWLLYLGIALLAGLATWFLPSVISKWRGQSTVPMVEKQTVGGGTVYESPNVPALAKAEKRGTVKKQVTERPVVTYRTESLPAEEAKKIPDVPPVVGKDNVSRLPELVASSVVPPWRGETHARAYLMGDGRTEIDLDPQREKFFGLDLRRLELEAGFGAGAKQFDATAAWFPLRLGDVHFGAKAELWMDPDGQFQGAGSVRFRWEPFR